MTPDAALPPILPGQPLVERGTVPADMAGRWLILWDGECGFCRRSVDWALRRAPGGVLAALPYQHGTGWLPELVLQWSPRQAHLRAPDGRYWGGGDAATELLALLGRHRLAALMRWGPVRACVGLGYGWVARNRSAVSRLFPRPRA